SKILSRGAPLRAISARSRPPPASDIARRFTERPPDRKSLVARFVAAGAARSANRTRNADRPKHLVQNGLERYRCCARTFLFLSANARAVPHKLKSTRRFAVSQRNSYLSGAIILDIPTEGSSPEPAIFKGK